MAGLADVGKRFSSPEIRRRVDRLLASDPGLGRLRNAVRIVLTVASAALVSYPIVSGGSTIAPLFGGIVSLLATMAVGDDTQKERKITTLLLLAPAALSATLGALLVSVAWLEALAVLVIVFLALYLRRFGPRYVAMGMMALIPLILSAFIRFGLDQLPWVLISAVIGILCAYVFRFFVMPDRPRSVLRRSMVSFSIQLGLTLDAVADTIEDRRDDEDRGKRLRREADRLNERATATEGQLSAEDAEVSRERSDRLRLYLFDAEMSANTLSEVAWRQATSECDFPPEVGHSLLRALREFRATLRRSEDLPAGSDEVSRALDDLKRSRQRAADGDATGWSFQVRRAEAALRQLSEGAGKERESIPDSEDDDDEEEESRQRDGLAGKLRPTTVQGIQAALAAGLGLLAGEALSPSRPYWVVITAFVVFMGSGTLGDTLSRGFQRTVGTLLGAVVGFLLASLVSGNLYLEAPLVVVCIFLAFYLFQISQALMMFWITVMLALVFDLIGQLSGGILVLRSFDTLLGSVIGLAVSALVLPTRTGDKIREGTADFLDALKGYVRDRVDRLAGGDPSQHPVEGAREVESKLQEVVQNATTARKQAVVFGRSRTDLDRRVTALMALSYYARHLAGPVNRGQQLEGKDRQSELLREVGECIAANLDSLREAISDGKQPEVRDIEDLMEKLEESFDERPGRREETESASERTDPTNALHYLRRINRTLGELASGLNSPPPG